MLLNDGWKKVRGDQTKTWYQCLKTLTSSLSYVGRCRLLGWSPRDYRNQWLETLGDMAQNRSQWRRCIHSLEVVVVDDIISGDFTEDCIDDDDEEGKLFDVSCDETTVVGVVVIVIIIANGGGGDGGWEEEKEEEGH
ncbi:uncharacterized protein DC041_0010338 [Schistosoma bovis]|uniref:Uncharacterized protein n=1 Tax=Schistosoma bovis TaxID=6184 RepID=A0A430PZI9_SCHBO|nr:uncharacterized protein DC041_0010338 [Schistosoma bovis]